MKNKGIDDGHIINIGSTLGHQVPSGFNPLHYYSMSKHALAALAEGTRNEVKAIWKNFRLVQFLLGSIELS